MLPLSDGIRAKRFPYVNVALIVANFLVWILYELPHLGSSVAHSSFYACTVNGACHHALPWEVSWFTSMFMHGSWDHILGNMLFLAIFGKNVEDAFGHLRYLGFYIAGGFMASLLQTAMTLIAGSAGAAQVATLGASGAIAAVLGAYFVLYPSSKVLTLVLIFFVEDPGLGLPRIVVPLPADRSELRPVLRPRQRRRRCLLRSRRRLHLRGDRRPPVPDRTN